METGRSREETLRSLGLKAIVQNKQSVEDGIHAVRMILPRCWFDKKSTEKGVNALRHYSRKWDAKNKIFLPKPKHDWSSHGSDAFRYLSLGIREERQEDKVLPRSARNDYDIFGV